MKKSTNARLYVITVEVRRDNDDDIFTHRNKQLIRLKPHAIHACFFPPAKNWL